MRPWYTAKPCERTITSHINFCIYDSTWEQSAAYELDSSEHVAAWVKNDHLGFAVLYTDHGIVRKYYPDFLVQLTNTDMLVIEVKGQTTAQDKKKYSYLQEWVKAVTSDGRFGRWDCAMATRPGQIQDILSAALRPNNEDNSL